MSNYYHGAKASKQATSVSTGYSLRQRGQRLDSALQRHLIRNM